MQVEVLNESGYIEGLRGMAYSFKDRASDVDDWWVGAYDRAEKRAPLLAPKDGGHNKFLESIVVWIDVEACRAFWSEFDTYRVGTTKQSESTMHTLSKRPPMEDDFEKGTPLEVIDAFREVWDRVKGDITLLKLALPEGFLQRRLVCTNYKVLRNIIAQRTGHRLKFWQQFIDDVIAQVDHPELLR